MLFDLRGRGRRRVVQVIYLFLAVLMGGGLVVFGIGGNTNGGLFDALKSGNGSSSATTSYTKQIDSLQKSADRQPKNAALWARLASLRLAEGGARGGFTGNTGGLAEFQQASVAWEHYVALSPPKVDLSVARQMLGLYSPSALNQADKEVGVMDLIINDTSPPDASLYQQYAVLAYTAGQTRKGDLAAAKAVSLAPSASRKAVKDALAGQKTAIAQATAQAAASASGAAKSGAATGAAPTVTAAPSTAPTTSTPTTAPKGTTTPKK